MHQAQDTLSLEQFFFNNDYYFFIIVSPNPLTNIPSWREKELINS